MQTFEPTKNWIDYQFEAFDKFNEIFKVAKQPVIAAEEKEDANKKRFTNEG